MTHHLWLMKCELLMPSRNNVAQLCFIRNLTFVLTSLFKTNLSHNAGRRSRGDNHKCTALHFGCERRTLHHWYKDVDRTPCELQNRYISMSN